MAKNMVWSLIMLLVCVEVIGRSPEKVNRGRQTIKALPGSGAITKGQVVSPKPHQVAETIPPVPQASDRCEDVNCGSGKECTLTADGEATCVCIQECHDRIRLICGSDGVTYTNKCKMRRAGCHLQTRLSVVNEGTCAPTPTDPSTTVNTPPAPRIHPVACYQGQRDALQHHIVQWLRGREAYEHRGSVGSEGVYDSILTDCFKRFDETEDALLDPNEFLKFVEHNETLRNNTDDLDHDLEEDNLLRGLCVDALLAEADENFDWSLSLAEFKAVMMPDFSPPTKMCSLEGGLFQDGKEQINKCNFCVCACGNWVCTANACDGYLAVGVLHTAKDTPGKPTTQ